MNFVNCSFLFICNSDGRERTSLSNFIEPLTMNIGHGSPRNISIGRKKNTQNKNWSRSDTVDSCILLHIPCIVKCIEQLLIANSLYSLLLTNTHTWQCQSNQDCCSRNCLSFSYKCIRERTEQPELPSHGNNQQPESPISGSASAGTAGSVQELVDRFGSDDGPDVNAAIPQRPSDSNAFVAPFRPPQQPDTQAPINIQGNRPCLTTGGNV